MDTLSHAAWGYALLRHRGRRAAWLGAVAGALPDVLFFVPWKIDAFLEGGWEALSTGRDPTMWRADGPPLPTDLVRAYDNYYVFTHSLVVLGLACALVGLIGKRHWLWFALPWAFHILLDLPTHARYPTPIFFPLSDWTMQGIPWSNPLIFWPHLAVLLTVYLLIWRKYRAPRTDAA